MADIPVDNLTEFFLQLSRKYSDSPTSIRGWRSIEAKLREKQILTWQILYSIRLEDLSKTLEFSFSFARILYSEIHPTRTMSQPNLSVLRGSGLESVLFPIVSRLECGIPSEDNLLKVDQQRLEEIGMSPLMSMYTVAKITSFLDDYRQTIQKKSRSPSKTGQTRPTLGRKTMSTKVKNKKKVQFKTFYNEKGLRYGKMARTEFVILAKKFNLQRQRFNSDKWMYRFTSKGVTKSYRFGLLKIIDLLLEEEEE
jgi:hypothetical protein